MPDRDNSDGVTDHPVEEPERRDANLTMGEVRELRNGVARMGVRTQLGDGCLSAPLHGLRAGGALDEDVAQPFQVLPFGLRGESYPHVTTPG